MAEFKYIIVDGLLKTGKTKLAEILANEFNSKLICDNQENPFIEDFTESYLAGNHSYSLKMQLVFLLNRYQQQVDIRQKGLFHKTTISDYVFYRDGIYAHVVLDDEDLEIYKKIFRVFSETVSQPDLAIYLQISFTEMMHRIRETGTDLEKKMPQDYWREIFEAYNYYFFNFKASPLLVVNMEKINLDDAADMKNLISEIRNHRKGTKYYAPA